MNVDYSNHLFRCSQLGKLMTGINVGLTPNQETTFEAYDERYKGKGKPLTEKQLTDYFDLGNKKHGKKVGLSQTAINHLKEIHRENIFCRNKEVGSKYTEKGIQVEEYSISLYTRVYGTLVLKNKERLTNKYFTGETDNKDKLKKIVRDFKSSWDFSTFPFFESEITNNDYDWQLQGYMDLTGMESGELVYCLVDTPYKQIDDELRRLDWKYNIFTIDGDVRRDSIDLVVETISNLIYSEKGLKEYCMQSTIIEKDWFSNFKEIPEELRVKVFKIEKDQNKINAMYNQCELAREFLKSLPVSESLKKTA